MEVQQKPLVQQQSAPFLLELAVLFRALNFAAHHAHNICARTPFFQDHAFFNEVYDMADDCYDDMVERHIGLFGDQQVNLQELVQKSLEKIASFPQMVKENAELYNYLLAQITQIQAMLKQFAAQASLGTNNLLADKADKLEVITYKIKQRIKR